MKHRRAPLRGSAGVQLYSEKNETAGVLGGLQEGKGTGCGRAWGLGRGSERGNSTDEITLPRGQVGKFGKRGKKRGARWGLRGGGEDAARCGSHPQAAVGGEHGSGARAARLGGLPQLDGCGAQRLAAAAQLRMAPGLQAFRFFCSRRQSMEAGAGEPGARMVEAAAGGVPWRAAGLGLPWRRPPQNGRAGRL